MKCPNCRRKIPKASKFCPYCGRRHVLLCPECGSEQPFDSTYCKQCGAKLNNKPGPPIPKEYPFLPGGPGSRSKRSGNLRGLTTARYKLGFIFALFYILLLSYVLLEIFFPDSLLVKMAVISGNPFIDTILLGLILGIASLWLYWLGDFCFRKVLAWGWYRPKLGTIMIYEGFITRVQLKRVLVEQNKRLGEILIASGHIKKDQLGKALSEQSKRLGEILIGSGRLTLKEVNQALESQQKVYKRLGEILTGVGHLDDNDLDWALKRKKRRLGEILVELGYASEDQIERALDPKNRKLGKILRQMGIITKNEFHKARSLQKYGVRLH